MAAPLLKLTTSSEDILLLTLNHPQALNALNQTLMKELQDALNIAKEERIPQFCGK